MNRYAALLAAILAASPPNGFNPLPSAYVPPRRRPGFVAGPADEARLAAAQAKRERRAARNLRGAA